MKSTKNSLNLITEFPLYKLYRYLGLAILPSILVFLLLQDTFGVEIKPLYKSLLIYILCMLSVVTVLARIKAFKQHFSIAHYIFLFGVMLINLFWLWSDPASYETEVYLVALNLIGLGMIKPLTTMLFYLFSIGAYLIIVFNAHVHDPGITFLIVSSSIVLIAFNIWRYHLIKGLDKAKHTYQFIFDNTSIQTYVLDKYLNILELNSTAKAFLDDFDIKEIINKPIFKILSPESENCQRELEKAVAECNEAGDVRFNINCAVGDSLDYVPKEMYMRKMNYFDSEAYVLNIKIIKAQREFEKELLAHKDNVTQILENINYFVFNITYDSLDRFRHHVNFVSTKVEDVYGYTVDEYISLVKAEKIDKDRHPEDKEQIKNKFDQLVKTGGKGRWRFRMNVNGKWRWIEEKVFVENPNSGNMVSLFGMVKDVTDEIEAEELLKESEERYKQIFETNLAGVYKTNIQGDLLDCNKAFADLLGFTIEELKANKIHQIYFDPQDRLVYLQELERKKQLNNYQVRLKRKDGRRLIVNNNVSVLEDESGSIIIGTLIDLTELHETSLALSHSEEKYRMLFEESNNAILLVVLGEDGNYIADINQMATELFDLDENELIGMDVADLLMDKEYYLLDMKQIRKDLLNGNRAELEWEFKRSTGQKFYAEVSFSTMVMEEEKVAQVVIKDISERKQYEKEILESRLSFKNIVDRSPASILIFSEKGELAYVNPNGEDLFLNVLNSKDRNLYRVFPEEKHSLLNDLIAEGKNDINSYTEIELGEAEKAKKYSINVVNTIYNFEKANLFILQDITLQTEYNIQKLRAEMAEETNLSLQEEIKRHKSTQRSLMESTSRLKALFESTGHLFMLTIDKNFNIVAQNENFREMVKTFLDKEVVIGMNFMDIFPIESYAYEKIIDRFESVFKGEPSDLISNFKSVKGEEVWMESFINPIITEDQKISEISFIAHNITEQVENRRRILQSEENNRAILLAIPDILFKANKDGVFTDYRAISEENRKAFQRFAKTNDIKGSKIEDVIRDEEIARQFKENILITLEQDKLVTHNFLLISAEDPDYRIHYENRYSKINDKEVVIISRDITSTVEYEEKLIESVKEKEVLLKEVHHRVKNNLQVINSILNLQSSYVKDDETLQIIIESQNRIRSMSYIHESLYQTKDFSSINFQDYITNLVQNLIHSYEIFSDKTELELNVDEVKLALDQAIPCGLILNELITNALKYAYPAEEGGKIAIEVFEKYNRVHIKVKDFGVGLPKDFNISETDSLGLSLVDTLIDQIDGELQLKTKNGTEFLIIFDKQEI